MFGTITSNLDITDIVYYTVALIVVTFLYRKKLPPFFTALYTLTILAFTAMFWQLPMLISFGLGSTIGLMNTGGYTTSFVYFIPLPLFILFYNIKLEYNRKKGILIGSSIITSTLYGLLLPKSAYYQLGISGSWANLSICIPRTAALIALIYLCYPIISNTRFIPQFKRRS